VKTYLQNLTVRAVALLIVTIMLLGFVSGIWKAESSTATARSCNCQKSEPPAGTDNIKGPVTTERSTTTVTVDWKLGKDEVEKALVALLAALVLFFYLPWFFLQLTKKIPRLK
jgi:hypothetical protein